LLALMPDEGPVSALEPADSVEFSSGTLSGISKRHWTSISPGSPGVRRNSCVMSILFATWGVGPVAWLPSACPLPGLCATPAVGWVVPSPAAMTPPTLVNATSAAATRYTATPPCLCID
jgi:hypothetical protein